MASPKQCFISYSHADYAYFEKLIVGVKALSNIYGFSVWHDRRIRPGSYWSENIQEEIFKSDIFVCLTTNAFFGSDYIFEHELPAIKHQHRTQNALVLPIVFEECCWMPFFGNYIELSPKTAQNNLLPVVNWKNRAEALGVATNAFARSIEDWFEAKPVVDFHTHAVTSVSAP